MFLNVEIEKLELCSA